MQWPGRNGSIYAGSCNRRRIAAGAGVAFGRLNVETADGDAADIDPENPGVVAVLTSLEGGWSPPATPDIVIQGGAGKLTPTPGAIRLTIDDIKDEAPQWTKLLRQLSTKLGLASLALAAEELEVALNATAQRADEAERNMAAALLNKANAIRENRQLQLDMAKPRERIAELQRENARLSNLNQSGRFAIGDVPETLREAVRERGSLRAVSLSRPPIVVSLPTERARASGLGSLMAGSCGPANGTRTRRARQAHRSLNRAGTGPRRIQCDTGRLIMRRPRPRPLLLRSS